MKLPNLNPIVMRETRGRMRNRRTFIGLTGYVGFLGALAGIIYAAFYYSSEVSRTYGNVTTASIEIGPYIGKSIFVGTVMLMLVMLPFTAAALASDAVAGERERQTYEMLRITSMSTQRLVWGKLGAVFSYLALHILVVLPILSFAFLFGGVSVGELLIALTGLLTTALGFGAWGLFISSLVRTTKMATALSSSFILLAVYGGPFLLWMVYLISPLITGITFDPSNMPGFLLYLYLGGFVVTLNPLGAAALTGTAIAAGYNYFFFSIPGPVTLWVISPWIVYVVFYLLFTLLLVQLTIRRLTKISEV